LTPFIHTSLAYTPRVPFLYLPLPLLCTTCNAGRIFPQNNIFALPSPPVENTIETLHTKCRRIFKQLNSSSERKHDKLANNRRYTDKKEKNIFLIYEYKETQMGAVAKSYIRKGFL